MELGYIGRWIRNEYMPININAVPYMMTMGGQRFDKAYANVVLQYCGGITGLAGGNCAATAAAVTPQPFFEAALANTGYCTGFSSCTAALVANEGAAGSGNLTNASVWSLWSDLDGGGVACNPNTGRSASGGPCGFNFTRSMLNAPILGSSNGANGQLTSGVGVNASIGYGNYNAAFVSVKMADWRGLTMQSNLTWSKALGTGAVVQATSQATAPDPFNLQTGYGLQGFDRKIVYNLFFVYQPSFYRGQQGALGRLLGGWTIAPIFAAGSGLPMTLGTINGGGQSFGEGDSVNFLGYGNSENAIPIGPIPGVSVHKKVAGSNGIGTSGLGINLWADPAAVFNSIRQPILGLDTRDGGFGVLRGLKYWNLDLSIKKNIKITEQVNFEFQTVFANVLNHAQLFDPNFDYLDTSNPASWGVLPGQQLTPTIFISPRTMEFGFRVNF